MARYLDHTVLDLMEDHFIGIFDNKSSPLSRSSYISDLKDEIEANLDRLNGAEEFNTYMNQIRGKVENAYDISFSKRPSIQEYKLYFDGWIGADRHLGEGYDGNAEEWYGIRSKLMLDFRYDLVSMVENMEFLPDSLTAEIQPIPIPDLSRIDLLIFCYALDHYLDPPDEVEKRRQEGKPRKKKIMTRMKMVDTICKILCHADGTSFNPKTVYKKPEKSGLSFKQHERVRDFLDDLSEVITNELNRISILYPDVDQDFSTYDFWDPKR